MTSFSKSCSCVVDLVHPSKGHLLANGDDGCVCVQCLCVWQHLSKNSFKKKSVFQNKRKSRQQVLCTQAPRRWQCDSFAFRCNVWKTSNSFIFIGWETTDEREKKRVFQAKSAFCWSQEWIVWSRSWPSRQPTFGTHLIMKGEKMSWQTDAERLRETEGSMEDAERHICIWRPTANPPKLYNAVMIVKCIKHTEIDHQTGSHLTHTRIWKMSNNETANKP